MFRGQLGSPNDATEAKKITTSQAVSLTNQSAHETFLFRSFLVASGFKNKPSSTPPPPGRLYDRKLERDIEKNAIGASTTLVKIECTI
jgi:hypothetical protein